MSNRILVSGCLILAVLFSLLQPQPGFANRTGDQPAGSPWRLAKAAQPAAAGEPGSVVSVRTGKEVYAPNEEIEVIFENMPGQPREWVALARQGAPDRRPMGRYRYLKGATSGRIALPGLRPGDYEVRAYRGGGHEVLARHPFQVQAEAGPAGKAPHKPPARSKATGPAPKAPSRAKEVKSPPSKPLRPELQRLIGTWIAHTRCDLQGNGEMSPQKILLTVYEDPAKPSGVSAQVRGIQGTSGIALEVTLDEKQQEYRFSYAGWLSPRARYRQKPYGLTLAFLEDRDLLHGRITGRSDCATVVAGRLPSEEAPPNPEGLLNKVAVNRVLEPLPEDDCAAYARWLAEGERFQTYGARYFFNSALGDAPAMRRILGHDLDQWTDEDSRKISVLHWACHKLLQASGDPKNTALANEAKIWGSIPPPLYTQKARNPDAWTEAYFALHQPLLAEILKSWELIEEGLAAKPRGVGQAEPEDKTGLAGEWRGYYHCEGDNQVFMRLVFSAGDPLQVRFESSSSLKTGHPFGVLAMKGRFDPASGRITLEPEKWILQPRGQSLALGLEGRLSGNGKSIEGQVKGDPDCPGFFVTKREISPEPVNRDGLLFHYLARGMIDADLDDCRNYAQWLASGEEINLGGNYFFSKLRDPDSMRAVLGKDLYQWGGDDHLKMRFLSRHCKSLLESQVDPEISELLARIRDKKLVWAPDPLDIARQDRRGETSSHWLRAEQLVMINQEQQALAARKLKEAEALPPTAAGIDGIDALVKEAGRGLRGPLGYLSKEELTAYLEELRAARVRKGVATADAAAEAWQGRPKTYAGLQEVESGYKDLRRQLEARKASQGVAALDGNFRRESDKRADALWPGVLETTINELKALAQEDLSRFRELGDDQKRQGYLTRFHRPAGGDPYLQTYESAGKLYRQTVDLMVKRSTPRLLTWIGALPPSLGANKMLSGFCQEVFRTAIIPERHPELKQAMAAKLQSYNPGGLRRPDIVLSLQRGQWNEVGLEGLEDLAYLTTSLRMIKSTCPGAVPEDSLPLLGFVWDLSQNAVKRILQGQVKSKREAERAVFLFLNTVFNRPGCRVNYFGYVYNCVSQEDQAAVQQVLMTSAEAQSDMRTLLGEGCGLEGAGGYVRGLLTYAGGRLPPAPAVLDFWAWMAREP